ncbi:DnaJ-domain-containing protein [Schizopora paradoxa]|uniref:DnaJ-domain-containing protein n=1 Tax=Schizopora paradoxa TaxID=27342 RepID=A0A0H2S0X6_9AGAM|nr:DnaJ-domain-containing protein [Schizopora paradoxa]
MATDLYETLNVSRDATAQEIRQAYRRMALDTHPDKLHRDATPEEKTLAQERFTKVNNAYEVLSDESRRQLYDRHGRWPIEERQNTYPEPSAHRHRSQPHRHHTSPFGRMHDPFNDPFSDPFFTESTPFGFGGFGQHHGRRRASGSRSPFDDLFTFTDPFELFRHVFADDPFFNGPSSHSPFPSPFRRNDHMLFPNSPFAGLLPQMSPAFADPRGMQSSSFQSQSTFARSSGRNGQWVSESRSTRTINGVTESEWRRVDQNGNVHVTRTYPDGRERYLLNGVEQAAPAHHGERVIEQPPPPPYPGPPSPTHARHISDSSRKSERRHRSDGPYDSAHIREERDRHHGDRKRRHDRGHVEPEQHFIDIDSEDRHKKHWWQRH